MAFNVALAVLLPRHAAALEEATSRLVRRAEDEAPARAPAPAPDDGDIFSDARTDAAFGGAHEDIQPGVTRRRRAGARDEADEDVWELIRERIWKGEKCFHGVDMIVWPIDSKNGSEIHLHAIDYGAKIATTNGEKASPDEHKDGFCGNTKHKKTITVICEHSGHYVSIRPLHNRPHGKTNFTICDVKFDGVAVKHPPSVGGSHEDPVYEAHIEEMARIRAEEEARAADVANERKEIQENKTKSSAWVSCPLSYFLIPLVTAATVVVNI